jgi:hypothetical protein
MKRTAATLALLAGFGGGCMSTSGPNATKTKMPGGYGTVTRPMAVPGVQGPGGEPVAMTAARGAAPAKEKSWAFSPSTAIGAIGIKPASAKGTVNGKVVQAHVPGIFAAEESGIVQTSGWGNGAAGFGGGSPPGGIYPVPGMGPPGAVAAVGAIVPGMRSPATNQRTSVNFTGPAGMKITWQLPGGGFNDPATGLTAPQAYNFVQGQVYRLRLTQVLPNYPGRTFYPTLEISPVTPKTLTFLAHSSVPVTFTDEDFRQASDGNLVVKVIYLPDPAFQDFTTVAGAEEIVSTRLEPGADPVAEAQRRGTVLAIIRLGNIDLENNVSPAMTAPPPGVPVPPPGFAPGMPPPGTAPVPPKTVVPPGAVSAPLGPVSPGPLPPTFNGGSRPTTLPLGR